MKLLFRTLPRFVVYSLPAMGLLVAIVILGLRYWLLPNIDQYRNEIAAAVSQAAGSKVTIAAIRANWDGLRPRLQMERVLVFDAHDNPALELVRVDATLSWRSLLAGSLRLNSLEIIQPTLEIKRDKAGKLFVAGMPISESQKDGGFGYLALDTRHLAIRDAVLSWEDELRGAPPLVLDGVSLHVENRGARHRFGLKAAPPAQLAGRIDLRGDVVGQSFADLPGWSGQVYAELPYADGGAWRSYVPLPKTFRGGRGGIRLWVDFQGQRVQSLVADVKLSDAMARLNDTLPELDLLSLDGRLRYRTIGDGFEVASEKLAFVTRGDTRVGSTDFLFRSEPKQKNKEARGEFRTNQMELAAWASLMEYLPLAKALKEKIAEFAPSGRVNNFTFQWTGEPGAPSKYSLNGHIERGAVKAVGHYPGVTGLNASVAADERKGSIAILGLASLNLAKVFNGPLGMDRFTAEASWQRSGEQTDIKLKQLTFANAHLGGTAAGSYRAIPGQRGVIDLNARLSRFDGSHLVEYLPQMLGPHTRAWLARGIVQAKSNDVTLRLAGDLRDFPFVDGKPGEFQVHAKLTEGIVDYAQGWPRIENIHADLSVRGRSLEVKASEANVLGARLKNVVTTIANLAAADPVVEASGEAIGPLAEKLRFISESPVRNRIGAFTDGIAGGGNGKLALKLSIPVKDSRLTRVDGDYQFLDASLDLGPNSPPITNVNGRLQFSEAGVRGQNIALQILGGPAVVNVTSRPEGEIGIDARGTATMAAIQTLAHQPLWRHVTGATDWQGRMTVRKGSSELKITSALTGIAANFPAPLQKSAAQEMPLTMERRLDGSKPEWLRVSLGDAISAEVERVNVPGQGARLKRGMVSFNKPAVLPAQEGLWAAGELRTLDIDRWREVLKETAGVGELPLSGIDITLDSIHAFDRSFANLHIVARAEDGNWQGSVSGRELAGEFTWRPAGKGQVFARLQRLTLPDAAETAAAQTESTPAGGDFPALDIVADELQIKSRKFGRLELKAEQQGRDWRIERLQLAQAEALLDADGLWSRGAQARTELRFRLVAPDAGKLLGELGFPNSVKRGKANLSGTLSWPGAPFEMLPANLSGNLKLEATAGQFLKAEPGAGRLLGLMSLQSLPRRISLDFRDIFSEGFSFDEIRGEAAIRQGWLTTRDFTITGPAAKVEMSGDVSLANETQQLNVKVIPTVGEGISLASGLLGGPVVGVTALILQKVLKDPINRAAAYQYKVTGTWDNPNVVKMERKAAAEETK